MFYPKSTTAKLFKKYLLAGNHVSKIRLQNLAGKYFFKEGIRVSNEQQTVLKLAPNDWISRMILMHSGYEQSSLELAKHILKDGGVFIDIGANFGLYTCTLSENKSVKVVAVEPNYMVLPYLLKNLKLNNRSNVTVLNTALSNLFQFVSLSLPQAVNLGSASFNANNKSDFSVLSCSLDFIFESMSIQKATLVKIDIEGNEMNVLKYFSFEKFPIKNILLEYNDLSEWPFEALHKFFTGKGFTIKNIKGEALQSGTNNVPENNLWLTNNNY